MFKDGDKVVVHFLDGNPVSKDLICNDNNKGREVGVVVSFAAEICKTSHAVVRFADGKQITVPLKFLISERMDRVIINAGDRFHLDIGPNGYPCFDFSHRDQEYDDEVVCEVLFVSANYIRIKYSHMNFSDDVQWDCPLAQLRPIWSPCECGMNSLFGESNKVHSGWCRLSVAPKPIQCRCAISEKPIPSDFRPHNHAPYCPVYEDRLV